MYPSSSLTTKRGSSDQNKKKKRPANLTPRSGKIRAVSIRQREKAKWLETHLSRHLKNDTILRETTTKQGKIQEHTHHTLRETHDTMPTMPGKKSRTEQKRGTKNNERWMWVADDGAKIMSENFTMVFLRLIGQNRSIEFYIHMSISLITERWW